MAWLLLAGEAPAPARLMGLCTGGSFVLAATAAAEQPTAQAQHGQARRLGDRGEVGGVAAAKTQQLSLIHI